MSHRPLLLDGPGVGVGVTEPVLGPGGVRADPPGAHPIHHSHRRIGVHDRVLGYLGIGRGYVPAIDTASACLASAPFNSPGSR
jgi:hypothetical protein